MSLIIRPALSFLLIVVLSTCVNAQMLNPVVDSIPMRDGKKLAADIYLPDTINQFPVILIQTPYNKFWYRFNLPLGIGTNLDSSNYVFVIVDWRCFYGSITACTGPVTNQKRGEDGYDVVEWIATQPWSDGKVGTWGPSALGKVQYLTAREQPPSLVCCVPLVAGTQFNYLEHFPGGSARTEYIEQLDNLGFGLSVLLYNNPVYNAWWQFAENQTMYPQSIAVPMFLIGGWYDHNTDVMVELFDTLRTSSDVSVRDKHRLLMGPWAHGGFGAVQIGTEQQGELFYPKAAGWSDSLAMVFFDYWLRNQTNGWDTTSFVTYFQMGENNWYNESVWPPSGPQNITFYLTYYGLDPITPDVFVQDSLSFVYDPTDPSPTYGGPTLTQSLGQGPYDQSDTVESRNDILIFTTAPFTQDVKLIGKPVVNLWVSSDRLDTDFSVRLTDVYPDGRSMLLSDGIIRMRFRNGYSAADTSVMVPGQIYPVTIELPHTANTFLAGHSIRLDITSSNYSRFNRNMNTGGEMYPNGNGDTLTSPLVATNSVFISSGYLSYIVLPLEGFSVGMRDDLLSQKNFNLRVYPSPSNNLINIQFYINEEQQLSIELLDISGKKISTISEGEFVKGEHRIQWETGSLPGGIYFIDLKGNKGKAIDKVAVIK